MDFEQFYQDKYFVGVLCEVDLNKYNSMVEVFEQVVKKYVDCLVFSVVGVIFIYCDLDIQSCNFVVWL